MSTIFYLRVSTSEQTTDNQYQELIKAGLSPDKVFKDEAVSGSSKAESREGWRSCIEYLREGDTLAVYAIDRLGRSTVDCLNTIQSVSDKQVRLIVLKQGFDSSTPAGKLALTMFAAFAEFETEIRKDRQMAGIARLKAEGGLTGRPKALGKDDVDKIKSAIAQGIPKARIAKELGIDRATVYRSLKY
jgi:putative DNA-invertase from lambdoid prophage Rac